MPRMAAILEPRAGVLFPEQCVAAHLAEAARHDARLHPEEPILSWKPDGQGVRVTTARAAYMASSLILAAGSWLQSLLPELQLPLRVERQILFWFASTGDPSLFYPESCPIHLWEYERRRYLRAWRHREVAERWESLPSTHNREIRELSTRPSGSAAASVLQCP